MYRSKVIDDIQSYLKTNYQGDITILGQEDGGDITPPSCIVRVSQSNDMGFNQAILWEFQIIVAVFHDGSQTTISQAETEAQKIFDLLADVENVEKYLESKQSLVSVFRPLAVEASRSDENWEHFASYELISSPLADPEVEFTIIPALEPSGGLIQWRGMGIGVDQKLYSVPYQENYLLVTDLESDTTLSAGTEIATWPVDNRSQKWVDCVSLDDGRIIANPHLAEGHLIIDTTTDPITTRAVESIVGPVTYGMQVRGGAVINNTLYSVSYDQIPGEESLVRVVDLETEKYGQFLRFPIDRTGPFYQENPDFANGGLWGAVGTDSYWGAVAGDNGKVYGVPFGQDRILIIEHSEDPAQRKAYQGVDTLTGGVPLSTGNVTPPDAYLSKYTGGVKSSYNNNIYCMPRDAHSILKIYTTTDRAVEIPLPASYLEWIAERGIEDLSKSLGAIEGNDGRIYGTWWQVPAILWIDPRTDYIGWIDMTNFDSTEIGATQNCYAYGQAVGNSIYFSPAAANTVLKMTIKK